MILSKSEMENIWQSKPYGYWQSYKKRIKKQKFYSCELQTFKWVYGEKETYAVKAESKYAAELEAKSLYRKKYNISDHVEGWKINVREM